VIEGCVNRRNTTYLQLYGRKTGTVTQKRKKQQKKNGGTRWRGKRKREGDINDFEKKKDVQPPPKKQEN